MREIALGILMLGVGVAVAGLMWMLFHPPARIRLSDDATFRQRERRHRTVNGLQQGWIALTGLPLTPADIRHLGWVVGAALTVILTLATHNPFIGTAFGLVGLLMPEALIRYWARKQWQRLDMIAYGAMHMLQAKIQMDVPVLEAFRALLPDVAEPFHSWVAPCLTDETRGIPLELSLKEKAAPIQHVELGALADVLAAERAHGRTAPVVARAVDLWSQRIQADAARRGKLSGSTMLGYGVVMLGIVAFWAIVLMSPTVRSGIGHGLGFWATGIGAWLIALAGWLQNRVTRQAEAV